MGYQPKRNNAIAYLRLLCHSGLAKEIVITEFLQAVQTLIPSENNLFTGVDADLNMAYFLFDRMADYYAKSCAGYATLYNNYSDAERQRLYVGWLLSHALLRELYGFTEPYCLPDSCNVAYRVYNHHQALWGLAIYQGKPVGILHLNRPRHIKAFDTYERTLFSQLLPYLAYAHREAQKDIHYAEPKTLATLVMDTQGKIVFLNQDAKHLLTLACHPTFALDTDSQEIQLLTGLKKLRHQLLAMDRGGNASLPILQHTNGRGRFTFHASWLEGINGENNCLVSVTIAHQEPVKIKILRTLRDLPLSPAQNQAAFLMMQGYCNEQISQRLQIKVATVKEYASKIYSKLDISRREELMAIVHTNSHVGQAIGKDISNIENFVPQGKRAIIL